MASLQVKLDMRTFTGRLHQKVKGKYIKSVSVPGVKTQIYSALYQEIMGIVPVDSGALVKSPLQNGSTSEELYSSKPRYKNIPHFAHGEINDNGIVFDPYTVQKRKGVVHYANDVKNFYPYRYINDNKEQAYEIIKQILVEEMNK